jgi:hypothetical protein
MIGCVLAVSFACALAGCNSSSDSGSGGSSLDELARATDAQSAARQQQQADAAARKAEEDKKAADQAAAAQAAPKAVGSRPAPEFGGYYGAIAGARRHVMNVADAISWIQGVRSFKAEEGRKPKNTDEFMKVVVPKYDLQLPKIEPDEEYMYDPKGETDGDFGQLYVVKKQEAGATGPAPGATPPTPGSVPSAK